MFGVVSDPQNLSRGNQRPAIPIDFFAELTRTRVVAASP